MMTGITGVGFAPLIPWQAIALISGVAVLLILFSAFRGARGTFLRLFSIAVLVLALFNPRLESETRQPQPDVAVIVVDESSSQNTGDRRQQLARALENAQEKLAKFDDLEVRVVRGTETEDGTQLFGELNRALADLPKDRFAGAVMITDGQVHDVPAPATRAPDAAADDPEPAINDAEAAGLNAPLHVMLTGSPEERDRRLVVVRAPAFGIVGKTVQLSLRVDDRPSRAGTTVEVTIAETGGPTTRALLRTGEERTVEVPIEHGGASIFEIEAAPMANEMSLINNRAVVTVNGVRDRLRVLLVSGQPHAGERTWRNLLKSDPSVDLVHFTILRPPEKNDFTPLNELALISFPIRELFEIKLHEFDLIVFDRYVIRFVLPPAYLGNISRYVRDGGAVLAAVGPDFAGVRSLYHTPLGQIFPGLPSGRVVEQAFRARVSDKGRRHPVTASLPGAATGDGESAWGQWFRQIEASERDGVTLMTGVDERPLLILNRVGKGRVAQFMSDHIWLWARGFDGGGPHAELLRRLSHWLMKEPDLEEEDLRATVDGKQLTIQRRSLNEEVPPVTVTAPSGTQQIVRLEESQDGSSTATITVEETGLYKIEDGTRAATAAVGKLNPPELSDLRASPDKLMPLIKASGGGISWIAEGLPDFRRTRPGRTASGNDWLGLVRNGSYVVTGVRQAPLLPALLFLLLAAGGLTLAWWREGQ